MYLPPAGGRGCVPSRNGMVFQCGCAGTGDEKKEGHGFFFLDSGRKEEKDAIVSLLFSLTRRSPEPTLRGERPVAVSTVTVKMVTYCTSTYRTGFWYCAT